MEYGSFAICSNQKHVLLCIDEAIVVTVKKPESALQTYNLTDLKELQSKAVLIKDHNFSTAVREIDTNHTKRFLNVRMYCVVIIYELST